MSQSADAVRLPPLLVTKYTATSCLGAGLDAQLNGLRDGANGLRRCDFSDAGSDSWIGPVDGLDGIMLPPELAAFDCRNNRLAEYALLQDGFVDAVTAAVARYDATRVGVFIGTSTAGILSAETAFSERDPVSGGLPASFDYAGTQNQFSVTDYVRRRLGVGGFAASMSSACSSSGKVFGMAQRHLAAGLIDAAVVGGVDSLCLTTLCGFRSLELLSDQPCRPFDAGRSGISIGEAAAFILLEPVPADVPADAVLLRAVGESSDAYHMSSPHPEGQGARAAMSQALAQAGLGVRDIGYINLHGTATPGNDSAEAIAVSGLFGATTPCSSTKGATGHALGAAGALEAVFSILALQRGFMPGGTGTARLDPALPPLGYQLVPGALAGRAVLSNSFGFGGTNCSLIFGLAA